MTQVAKAILQLHPSSRQAWQITALAFGEIGIPKGLLHEAVHPAPPFVLTIGQHSELAIQSGDRVHIGRIHTPRQWILHQLHADAVQVLHDQQVFSTGELLQQLIGRQTGHGGSGRSLQPKAQHCNFVAQLLSSKPLRSPVGEADRTADCKRNTAARPSGQRTWRP